MAGTVGIIRTCHGDDIAHGGWLDPPKQFAWTNHATLLQITETRIMSEETGHSDIISAFRRDQELKLGSKWGKIEFPIHWQGPLGVDENTTFLNYSVNLAFLVYSDHSHGSGGYGFFLKPPCETSVDPCSAIMDTVLTLLLV